MYEDDDRVRPIALPGQAYKGRWATKFLAQCQLFDLPAKVYEVNLSERVQSKSVVIAYIFFRLFIPSSFPHPR